MKLTPQEISRTAEGVRVRGDAGDVLLRKNDKDITAHYLGKQLVNGSAHAYAEKLRQSALRLAEDYPLPWFVDEEKGMQVTEPRSFYAETFSPSVAGIETLVFWRSQSSGKER